MNTPLFVSLGWYIQSTPASSFHMMFHARAKVKVVFSADEAVRRSKDGDKVILVRIETSPDDIHGLHAAEGVLTTRGERAP